MRIFQVVHNLSGILGGTETYTYALSKQLSKNNEIYLIYRDNNRNKEEFGISIKEYDAIKLIGINNTLKNTNDIARFYNNRFITQIFSDLLDKFKPDLVHLQHLLFLSLSIVEEIKKRRIPLVFTLHDYWLVCPDAKLLKYDLSICDGYKNCHECVPYLFYRSPEVIFIHNILKRSMPDFLSRQIKDFYFKIKNRYANKIKIESAIEQRENYINTILKMVDLFIAPSKFLKDKMIQSGIPKEKMLFLQYGINKDNFKNFERNKSDRLILGYLGSLTPAKGIDGLIKAFNKLRETKAELRIYGNANGFESYQRYLKKIVQNKNILFLGPYNHEDTAKILNEIDLLIVPSIWQENSPLVIHEAFAAKVPVIASNIGGIPELVKDGINGLLFNPRDSDDLYKKIDYICKNREIIEEFRKNIPPVKSIEENAQEMEKIYRSLIKICIS